MYPLSVSLMHSALDLCMELPVRAMLVLYIIEVQKIQKTAAIQMIENFTLKMYIARLSLSYVTYSIFLITDGKLGPDF